MIGQESDDSNTSKLLLAHYSSPKRLKQAEGLSKNLCRFREIINLPECKDFFSFIILGVSDLDFNIR